MFVAQCSYLDQIASLELPQVSISPAELHQHKIFFSKLQGLCENAILEQFPKLQGQFSLMQYGSLQSGFAVKGSDMDAVLSWTVPPSDLVRTLVPRLLEKRILQAGHGARLLSKTRVPILKVCADPTDELQSALLEERKKWEENPAEDAIGGAVPVSTKEAAHGDGATKEATDHIQSDQSEKDEGAEPDLRPVAKVKQSKRNPPTHSMQQGTKTQTVETDKKPKQRNPGPWVRERASGPLDFPKDGVGIQCDISFTKPIGMYNTHLLRCYSICDPRVRDMVLFVKGWAKQRKINSGYHGTLSSYGWVLMVLHFLINIARPPVLPNLQLDFGAAGQQRIVDGYDINFADDETQLLQLAAQGRMTRNQEPLGALLRNFFYYFAQQGNHIVAGGFNWRDSIISIRTRGGLLHKSDKEWTTAQTLMVNGFEVRQRYILAIECPFETDHNVARTVLHNGVVAIRDEFRRVWRVLEEVGYSRLPRESLFAQIREQKSNQRPDKKQNRKSDLQPNHKSEQKPSHKSDQQPSQVPKPVDPKEPTRTSAESTKTDL
jgi:terminal uridylyltransferase